MKEETNLKQLMEWHTELDRMTAWMIHKNKLMFPSKTSIIELAGILLEEMEHERKNK